MTGLTPEKTTFETAEPWSLIVRVPPELKMTPAAVPSSRQGAVMRVFAAE